MSAQTITRRLTQADLAKRYAAGEKIVMFTCYDASFARLLDGAGVETLLIGDSLGNVIQGHDTTLPVTVADIAYHVAAVKRGSDRPFIIADMPFGSYQCGDDAAMANAVETRIEELAAHLSRNPTSRNQQNRKSRIRTTERTFQH